VSISHILRVKIKYDLEYNSALKRKAILTHAATQMKKKW
jgi:hypothetical protein